MYGIDDRTSIEYYHRFRQVSFVKNKIIFQLILLLILFLFRIMVLNSGILVELDKPSVLLDNADGHFYSLWQKHLKSHGGASLVAAASDSNTEERTQSTSDDSKRKDIAL
jgi:hypothetical protein